MKNYIYHYQSSLLVVCMIAAVFAGCSGNKSETSGNDADTTAVADTSGNVTTAKDSVDGVSSATNVANKPTYNGIMMVAPQQKATLALTMGGKIHSLKIMPGQAVTRGQVVATIDNPEYIELQHDYLDASAQLEYLEKEYDRQRTLGAHDAASQKKVQQSRADYLSMRSRLSAAAARLNALGINTKSLKEHGIQAYLPVTAPISGYVTNLDANLGKYLDAGEPICDIINKSQPLLQLTVYEKDIAQIKNGKDVVFRVNGMGKQTFNGTVVSIEQSVSDKDYSIKVYVKTKGDVPVFRPGMYVRARLKD
ncbi:MAG: efflux RND transporter periplasmic adaptor subunit [Prevotella sp.]